jgi:hypothetical protein
MPILIDELLVEAEPPRSPAPPSANAPAAPEKLPGQADRMLELSIVNDRHERIQVD